MKLSTIALFALPLVLAAAASAPVAAQSAGSTKLELGYGAGTPCEFITTTGLTISGAQAGVVNANGSFGSGCPTGTATGVASVSISASDTSVDVDTPAIISWNATADVCHYNGTSFPVALAGWPSASGDACIGATACAQAHSYTANFTSSGSYTFGLTCWSGEHGSQPETPDPASVTVAVTGGTAPPQTGQCDAAPAGTARQTSGTIRAFTERYPTQTNLTQWSDVFGRDLRFGTQYGWPGSDGTGVQIQVNRNAYLSLGFTVPSNFTQFTNASYVPVGTFLTNGSGVTPNIHWSLSITQDCGDFTLPAPLDPDYKCFATYRQNQGQTLSWIVTPVGADIPGACNLHPGQTYYLNIIAAPFSNPSVSECPSSSCTGDFTEDIGFDTGPLMP